MKEYTALYLPWILSAITVYTLWATGNKDKKGWLVGIGNQILWLLWIWASSSWGLIPMNLALMYLTVINYFKWAKEEKEIKFEKMG